MIAIIDYGAGNIKSVINAFENLGKSAVLISNPDELKNYDRAVLPGVGAFGEAIEKLKKANLDLAILEFIKTGKPFLGVCLGMQLLFEKSYEFGENHGLGVIKGSVVRFDETKFSTPLKVPHVGWNSINFTQKTPINRGLNDSEYLYFVHSFHAICDDKSAILGTSEYGYDFVSAVAKDNVFGFQPHPEKSHEVGLKILENFTEL
ncbi:imidazole glycerol phosphate synthase subunit HisH [Campylobacter gastrosuis]|uniref:Imidazole glycerol phosphate synthase subunit HisH n=1 Tax=Campylobacter gastrosuis TaxID=2974576 RepID=A0ABT7HL97_9BACT|nr:imidazole glycerol phosphate synthase subunit HisH [Campylobacter gastrosuis]MDL0087787.1 imidazole glycerol phosphate synthase subunit HisH [Campylobacter gastrosuis]MDL0087998.1 imidazole glycerol phosphate synthase subunit HisH [Campylobacter gastrosuis]